MFDPLCAHLFPQRKSYPEFEQSLFAGNGSFAMMQHSQMNPQPPALAHLSCPVKNETKVDN